MRKCYWA